MACSVYFEVCRSPIHKDMYLVVGASYQNEKRNEIGPEGSQY